MHLFNNACECVDIATVDTSVSECHWTMHIFICFIVSIIKQGCLFIGEIIYEKCSVFKQRSEKMFGKR